MPSKTSKSRTKSRSRQRRESLRPRRGYFVRDKFIILDRDGTIIKDKGYNFRPEDIEFLPGAIEGLQNLQNAGYKFIIISNQAGIARKYYNIEAANKFNKELAAQLIGYGIKIEKIYICPHHPDITGECSCRKPNTGLALQAAKEFNINLKDAYFIGDKDCDIELGKNCGGKTCLINGTQYKISSHPDLKVRNLKKFCEAITKTS